jgi:hypothetical protein
MHLYFPLHQRETCQSAIEAKKLKSRIASLLVETRRMQFLSLLFFYFLCVCVFFKYTVFKFGYVLLCHPINTYHIAPVQLFLNQF